MRKSHLMCVIFALAVVGCDQATKSKGRAGEETIASELSSGHQKMLDELAAIADDYESSPLLISVETMHRHRAELKKLGDSNPVRLFRLHLDLGSGELALGNVEGAIEHLSIARDIVDYDYSASIATPSQRVILTAKFALALAYLRLGEVQNCCLRHTADSCIVPIRNGGLHDQRQGSERAMALFLEILQASTDDAPDEPSKARIRGIMAPDGRSGVRTLQKKAKWLLHIAAMTLDQYPEGIPPAFRIDESFFRSKIAFPRFENIAPKLGLETLNLCGSVVIDDFNNDGSLDIFSTSWDPTRAGQSLYYQNKGDGTFSNRTKEAGLTGLYGGLNLVHADYDNDGFLDVFILRGAWAGQRGRHSNSLLRNRGDGTFEDVSFAAGVGDTRLPTKTAVWFDYDLDGDVDLFVGNENGRGVEAPSQLFRNNGNGTFTDVATNAGLSGPFFAMGVAAGDFDNDRYPDLYVSKDGGNALFRNNRDGTFTDITKQAGVTRPHGLSFATWFWDYNNDGNLDIFVGASVGAIDALTDYAEGTLVLDEEQRDRLFEGDGKGAFVDVSVREKLHVPSQPMGANYGDLDNDGWLDFYLATGNVGFGELHPNLMFVYRPGSGFVDVTMSGGFGHLQKGHGVSFADIDNDGDQDVYEQLGGAFPADTFNDALFENPGFGSSWITLKLVGTKTNRAALGARVRVDIRENNQRRSIYRSVTSGGSFGSNPLRVQIGLGDAEAIERLEIRWPVSQTTQVFENVGKNQFIRIVEGADAFTQLLY